MPWPGELQHSPNEAHIRIYKVRPRSTARVEASSDILRQSSSVEFDGVQLRFSCCPVQCNHASL